jgi:hypothetical protein
MDYHKCQAFTSSKLNLCKEGEVCYALGQLESDFELNLDPTSAIRTTYADAIRFAQACIEKGCACSKELLEFVNKFPEE